MDSINNYYIYVYLDPRKPGRYEFENLSFPFEPIYVGKGKHNRDMYHWKYYCDNEILRRKLIKIKNDNLEPIIMRIQDHLSESAALENEARIIKSIGRLNLLEGSLCNLTNGGEGVSGLIQTPEQRQLNSVKNSRTYEERYGLETATRLKKLRSEKFKGNTHGKNLSEESRKKISIANKKSWAEKYGDDYVKKRNTCYHVVSPTGQEYIIFSNNTLVEFAQYMGMPKTSLMSLTWKSAKKEEYKQWTCKIIGTEYEFDTALKYHYNNTIIWRN